MTFYIISAKRGFLPPPSSLSSHMQGPIHELTVTVVTTSQITMEDTIDG